MRQSLRRAQSLRHRTMPAGFEWAFTTKEQPLPLAETVASFWRQATFAPSSTAVSTAGTTVTAELTTSASASPSRPRKRAPTRLDVRM